MSEPTVQCVMDFPTAWAFIREQHPDKAEHDPRCSWAVAGMLCDCHIIWDEYDRRAASVGLAPRKEPERTVDDLLHDAEHADSGLLAAGMVDNREMQKMFAEKRDRLIAEAHAADPTHSDPAWAEFTLPAPPAGPDTEGSQHG